MDFPQRSARYEQQILSLVAARAESTPLTALEAAQLALRLREAMEAEEEGDGEGEPSGAPRVPVEDSVHHNYLVCLETGERMVLLKRHLMKKLNMTPEEYRRKWKLPKDYPMIAEGYASKRSRFRR